MEIVPMNYLAIIAGAIIYMVVGTLWYSPKLFGGAWMSEQCKGKEDCKPGPKTIILAVINALVGVFVLSLFIHHTQAVTAADGACVAVWAWLGFVVTTHFSGVIWEGCSWKMFFVHIGCMLVSMVAAGVLLAVWR